mgnify:CR=1 FL=1
MLIRWWIVMIEPRAGRAERSEAVPHRSMCACGEEDPDDVRAGRDDSSISRLQPSEASRRRRQPFAQVFRAGSPMAAAAVAGADHRAAIGGHLGGAVAGAVCGFVMLAPRWKPVPSWAKWATPAAVAVISVLGSVLVVG